MPYAAPETTVTPAVPGRGRARRRLARRSRWPPSRRPPRPPARSAPRADAGPDPQGQRRGQPTARLWQRATSSATNGHAGQSGSSGTTSRAPAASACARSRLGDGGRRAGRAVSSRTSGGAVPARIRSAAATGAVSATNRDQVRAPAVRPRRRRYALARTIRCGVAVVMLVSCRGIRGRRPRRRRPGGPGRPGRSASRRRAGTGRRLGRSPHLPPGLGPAAAVAWSGNAKSRRNTGPGTSALVRQPCAGHRSAARSRAARTRARTTAVDSGGSMAGAAMAVLGRIRTRMSTRSSSGPDNRPKYRRRSSGEHVQSTPSAARTGTGSWPAPTGTGPG